jgi:hypothetical protein
LALTARCAKTVRRCWHAEKTGILKFSWIRAYNPRFAENFGPDLIARNSLEDPGARLRFVQKLDKDSAPLREGTVDLENSKQQICAISNLMYLPP